MRFLIFAIVFCFSLPAFGETIDTGEGAKFDVPQGWKKHEPRKTSVALLKSASNKSAQIDVRVAPVKADKSSQFFTTFHAALLNNGMKKKAERKLDVSEAKAVETEYSVKKKGEAYRVIVVQFQKENKSWLVVGMFPEKKRDGFYEGMVKMLSSLKFG